MIIETRKIAKKCTQCEKEYSENQTIINGVPSYKFAICPECLKKLQSTLDKK